MPRRTKVIEQKILTNFDNKSLTHPVFQSQKKFEMFGEREKSLNCKVYEIEKEKERQKEREREREREREGWSFWWMWFENENWKLELEEAEVEEEGGEETWRGKFARFPV